MPVVGAKCSGSIKTIQMFFSGGHKHPKSNKGIDYFHLAKYCLNREGQVIVCENDKADWLPFQVLKENKGANNKAYI